MWHRWDLERIQDNKAPPEQIFSIMSPFNLHATVGKDARVSQIRIFYRQTLTATAPQQDAPPIHILLDISHFDNQDYVFHT
jgi:hypothetical protein